MAKKTCDKHGDHVGRKCPACVWVGKHPGAVKFQSGCPRCGKPLSSNGMLMWCDDGDCPMMSTSHPA